MPIGDSLRFRRQLGLVWQERIRSLRIAVVGGGPALPWLLQNLAMVGFGRGSGEIRLVSSSRLSEADIAGQLLFDRADAGLPVAEASAAALERSAGELNLVSVEARDDTLADAADAAVGGADLAIVLGSSVDRGQLARCIPVLAGELGAAGVALGPIAPGVAPGATQVRLELGPSLADSPFRPALASLLGALLAQEALVALGLFRTPAIRRVRLKLALDLDATDAPVDLRLDGLGRGAGLRVREVDPEDGGRSLEVTLPADCDLVWRAWDRLHVGAAGPAPAVARRTPTRHGLRYRSPFERMTPARDRELGRQWQGRAPRIAGKEVRIGGVGGLGSWVAPLVALSGWRDSRLELLDRDRIEGHNLNRQVLFRAADVGRAKAEAAGERLAGLDPGNEYRARVTELTLDAIAADGRGLAGGDLLVSLFDNAYARFLFGMLAEEQGRTLLDAGGAGLDGNVNLYRPGRHCILCHWNQRRDFEATWAFARERGGASCQAEEAGSSRIGEALVTTTAVLASAAAAVALATLAGEPTPGHQATYLARSNELSICPLQERAGDDGCLHHRHGPEHERHRERFRAEREFLEARSAPAVAGAGATRG